MRCRQNCRYGPSRSASPSLPVWQARVLCALRKEGKQFLHNGQSRGLSPIVNLVIGSVATKVIYLVEVPVTLIK